MVTTYTKTELSTSGPNKGGGSKAEEWNFGNILRYLQMHFLKSLLSPDRIYWIIYLYLCQTLYFIGLGLFLLTEIPREHQRWVLPTHQGPCRRNGGGMLKIILM